jgi:hypothetical protein
MVFLSCSTYHQPVTLGLSGTLGGGIRLEVKLRHYPNFHAPASLIVLIGVTRCYSSWCTCSKQGHLLRTSTTVVADRKLCHSAALS